MKIGILGGGESGVGAALLAKAKGHQVFVSDHGQINNSFKNELIKNKIRFEEGGHSFEILESKDLIVKSPGISNSSPIIQHLHSKKLEIIGEIEYAYRYCEGIIIGITGTNGKTTTTNLTYHILHSSGYNVEKCGNIGKSFARSVLEGYEWYVIELSSFQLEDIIEFKPTISALLNISPDHLDRYQNDISKYLKTKARISLNQSEENVLFIPKDERIFDLTSEGSVQLEVIEADNSLMTDNLFLKGEHNLINATFAAAIARRAGITDDAIQTAISSFVNDNHRLQPVGIINEVLYINDSKATNVDAVYYALRAFTEPIIWIVGGEDKGNDYNLIEKIVEKRVKHIVALGKDNSKILKFFKGKVKIIKEAKSMKEAIAISSGLAHSGDVVLLSPACASFDLFEDYKDRGEQFIKEVWEILK